MYCLPTVGEVDQTVKRMSRVQGIKGSLMVLIMSLKRVPENSTHTVFANFLALLAPSVKISQTQSKLQVSWTKLLPQLVHCC